MNDKINILNEVIGKKEEALRKEREMHNEAINGLLHNSNSKKQEKMMEYKVEDSRRTSPEGIMNEELISRVRELERENKGLLSEMESLENTNRRLREQLMSNLNTFDREKELYEEINMLKARVKGYEELKRISKM